MHHESDCRIAGQCRRALMIGFGADFLAGGNDRMSGMDVTQTRIAAKAVKDDPKLQEQIASLNAAVLHDLTIAPAAVAGGQIVTQKLKFARKEAHDLHLVVDFNGEQHEFDFAAPPPR